MSDRPQPDPAVHHGVAGEIVRKLDPTTEADPVAVLATLLSAAGVCIGPGPHVIAGDSRHPLLVNTLLLGTTSAGKKGTSYAAVRRVLAHAARSFLAENVTSGLSSGEGLITEVADNDSDDGEEEPPDTRRLIVEEEFGGTLARARREGNTLAAVIRQAWDGGTLKVLNVKNNRHVATGTHIAILGHITPGEFSHRVSDADLAGGTYNRFLPIYCHRSKLLADGGGAADDTVHTVARLFSEAVGAARETRQVFPDEDAFELWRDVIYPELASHDHEGPLAGFVARAAPYTLRLAALYAVLDGRHRIERGDLVAAHALVTYSRESAAHVLGEVADDDERRVVAAIAAAGEQGMTRRQIQMGVFTGHMYGADLDDLLERVSARADITEERKHTGGRPTAVYTYTDGDGAEESL